MAASRRVNSCHTSLKCGKAVAERLAVGVVEMHVDGSDRDAAPVEHTQQVRDLPWRRDPNGVAKTQFAAAQFETLGAEVRDLLGIDESLPRITEAHRDVSSGH